MADTQCDVAIVGAGPVGLALAKGLALDGRKVLVLEKNPRLSEHSKAVTIWPRTQEVFDRMGLLATFEQNSLIREELHMTDTDKNPPEVMLTIPLHDLKSETKYPRLLLIPQNETERLLFESLREEKDTSVEFSAAVTALEDKDTHVIVKYTRDSREQQIQARFVVGCDGAHSAVRSALGFHLEGETYAIKAGLADIKFSSAHDEDFPRVTTKTVPCFALRASKDLWRLIFIGPTDLDWDLEKLASESVQTLFGETKFELVWVSDFKLHRRISEFFGKGNLVLAGDAAHLNSPIGGQGMNSGIQETEALRIAFTEAFATNSSKPLLTDAAKRRATIATGVNRFTGMLTSAVLFGNGRYLKPMLRSMSLAFKVPAIKHAVLRKAAMLD